MVGGREGYSERDGGIDRFGLSRYVGGLMDGQTAQWIDGGRDRQKDGWIDVWVGGWIDVLMDEWVDGDYSRYPAKRLSWLPFWKICLHIG